MNNSLDRRHFLKLTSRTLAAAALSPTLLRAAEEAASNKKRAIKKAIMYATVGVKGTVREKFQAIKEAGFAGVEPMSHMDQDEVVKALDATGLQAASVCGNLHWAKPLSDPNPAVRDAGLEGLKQTLKDAKRYGATSVLLVPGVVTKKISYDECWTRSQAEIRKAVPLAEQLGVRIAIENVWNQFIMSPLEAARYVDEFNSPMVGWHLDLGNLINYGWPEHWVRILGKRISRLHIKEYSRSKRDKSGPSAGFNVEFLEGDNDWPAIMKALDEVGYTSWGIAEQGGGNSPEGLKNLSDRMDRIFAS